MAFPNGFWIILLAAALGCSVGFKKFIWFISAGYGLAMSMIGATIGVMSMVRGTVSIPFLLMCAVIFAYGLRLGLFLIIRETRNAAYRKTLASAGGDARMPAAVLVSMWLLATFLYYMQSSGLFYRLSNGLAGKADAFMWIGCLISLTGFLMEAVADAQKSAQKKENPDMVATKGLFRMCRCPNYFGEILVWTGVTVSGIPVARGGQWVIMILGYVAIVYIMFDGAKRLELRQTKRCFRMKEYVDYSNRTPILIPFLPIYHLIDWIQ